MLKYSLRTCVNFDVKVDKKQSQLSLQDGSVGYQKAGSRTIALGGFHGVFLSSYRQLN